MDLTDAVLDLCSLRHSSFCLPVGHPHLLARILATLGCQLIHTLVPCFCPGFVGPCGSQDVVPEDGVGRKVVLR